MDRKEIKELAKQKIKDNKWKILWPLLIISLISGILTNFIGPDYDFGAMDFDNFDFNSFPTPTPLQSFLFTLVTIIVGIANIAYYKYLLNFVRGKSCEFNDIMDTIKSRWVQILLVETLMGIIIFLFSLLLVIPGIIKALAYSMAGFIVVDTDLEAKDVLKKSKEMMNGYKWDYFVFGLSFIGWFILVPFTIGILLIWLIPYMLVSMALYYEKLKELNS